MRKGPNPTLEYWLRVGIYLQGIYKNNYIFRILTPINIVVIIFILMHCTLSIDDQILMKKEPSPTLEYWPRVRTYLWVIYKNNYIFKILSSINTVVIIFILMHCTLNIDDQTLLKKEPSPTLEYWPRVGIYLRGIY